VPDTGSYFAVLGQKRGAGFEFFDLKTASYDIFQKHRRTASAAHSGCV